MARQELIEFLLNHNQKQCTLFCSPDEALLRRQYRFKHPTMIAAMKCMDGRLNLPIKTNTPPGIIQPFRNIGGKFDLGWPFFGEILNEWVRYAVSKGTDCLILVTYHWSKGNEHRGCKGFNYDLKAAIEYTKNLKIQVERVFGKNHFVVYPIQVGIETDQDTILLHGENGKRFDLADHPDIRMDELQLELQKLYPDMKEQVLQDFLPLLMGNLQHAAEVKKSKRPLKEAEHKEQILAIGRGFDWLHLPNKALIIGPYSYNLAEPIITAANLLLDNLKKGRIPKNKGVIMMSSATYKNESGPESFRAIEKTLSLANFTLDTIKNNVPELVSYIEPLIGIVNENTRFFTRVKPKD